MNLCICIDHYFVFISAGVLTSLSQKADELQRSKKKEAVYSKFVKGATQDPSVVLGKDSCSSSSDDDGIEDEKKKKKKPKKENKIKKKKETN